MLLPIKAGGPLKVETKPILMVSPACAGPASARAVAPASQNAVFIFVSLLLHFLDPADRSAHAVSKCAWALDASFCARNGACPASANRRPPLRTFGSMPMELHHNSYALRMARIIVPVAKMAGCGFWSWPMRRLHPAHGLSNCHLPRRAIVTIIGWRFRCNARTRTVPTIRVRDQAIGKVGLEAKA